MSVRVWDRAFETAWQPVLVHHQHAATDIADRAVLEPVQRAMDGIVGGGPPFGIFLIFAVKNANDMSFGMFDESHSSPQHSDQAGTAHDGCLESSNAPPA